jgi:hypothetical protein
LLARQEKKALAFQETPEKLPLNGKANSSGGEGIGERGKGLRRVSPFLGREGAEEEEEGGERG